MGRKASTLHCNQPHSITKGLLMTNKVRRLHHWFSRITKSHPFYTGALAAVIIAYSVHWHELVVLLPVFFYERIFGALFE